MGPETRWFVCECCGFKGDASSFLSCPAIICKSHEPYKNQRYGYGMPYPKFTDKQLKEKHDR